MASFLDFIKDWIPVIPKINFFSNKEDPPPRKWIENRTEVRVNHHNVATSNHFKSLEDFRWRQLQAKQIFSQIPSKDFRLDLPQSAVQFRQKCEAETTKIEFNKQADSRHNDLVNRILEQRKAAEALSRENKGFIDHKKDLLRVVPKNNYKYSDETFYNAVFLYKDRDRIDQNEFYRKPTLPTISSKHEALIEEASKPYPNNEVLVELPGQPISRKDIQTLFGLNWLNDEVINFYMSLIMERGKISKQYPNVYSFNTFFYPKLRSSGHSSLKRWTKKVDIFSYELLFVPVHVGQNHWCLAMVDFTSKEISYYDSLGGSSQNCQDVLLRYLCDESLDKRKREFSLDGWQSNTHYEQIPQQRNGSDCGVFTCTYAEYLSRRAKLDFEQKDMPYFRRKMIVEIMTKQLLIV